MTTVKQSVPLFLSSSRDVTGDTDETSFTVRLSPPLNISDQAKKVTAFIDSATVPYSFPNVTAQASLTLGCDAVGAQCTDRSFLSSLLSICLAVWVGGALATC